MVGFTSQPFYHRGKNPWHILNRRPGELNGLSGRLGEEQGLLLRGESKHGSSVTRPVAVSVPTVLSRPVV
jgi:hypothetical protein